MAAKKEKPMFVGALCYNCGGNNTWFYRYQGRKCRDCGKWQET